jgi:hypothetical protein
MKVLVDVDVEANPEPVQCGDTASDVKQVKYTNM